MPTDYEALVLDSLALHTGDGFSIEALSMPVPAALAEWIKGADSHGARLARPPLHENRTIEARIRVDQTATRDLANAKIGTLLDKLQECAQQENGLPLVWTSSNGTLSMTFRCLHAVISDMPIDWEGWLATTPILTVQFTCLPFGEGAEYTAGTVTSADPMQTLTLSNVPGDVPAKGRLVVTDSASQRRRYAAWGMESRHLPTTGAPALTIDSTSMVTAGYSGTAGVVTSGAHGGTTIQATVRPQVQAVCGLGDLAHVGTFRPHLRVRVVGSVALRLVYQTLDGPFRRLSYKIPVEAVDSPGAWNHIDLGSISIPPSSMGTQKWTGRIEAYATTEFIGTIYVDVLYMVPAEAYGKARAAYSYSPGLLSALADFSGGAAGSALHGWGLTLGSGTWQTSGVATDFTNADGPLATDETASRSTVVAEATPREAEMGTSVFTDLEFSFDFYRETYGGDGMETGCHVRYVDSSNYLKVYVYWSSTVVLLNIQRRISGALWDTKSKFYPVGTLDANTWYRFRVIVFASGNGRVTVERQAGGTIMSLPFYAPQLTGGGALASGKNRIFERIPFASAIGTRYYDNVYASTAAAEPIVCHLGQSIEFRHDSTLREDSTGTYAGPPPEYIGGRFFVPPAGAAARQARIAVIARRNDVDEMADDFIADSLTTTVYLTPQYLAVPR